MGQVYALDTAYSVLTASNAACLLGIGYPRAIIGPVYSNIPHTENNLAIARAAGFQLETYAYIYLGGDVRTRVKQTIDLGLGYGATRLWIDLEDDGNGESGVPNPAVWPTTRVLDVIAQCVDACEGYPYGLYSGDWWWKPATGDNHSYADAWWWIAQYDGIPDLTVFRPFAGITALTGKQYQGSHIECGIEIDSSIFVA